GIRGFHVTGVQTCALPIYTSAGTTLGLSAAAPATYDAAGYAALTFTQIGEVSDLGDIPARIYELVTWQPLAERGMRKAKGGYQRAEESRVGTGGRRGREQG